MPNWLFALVVLGIGLGLAIYVDRMKNRPGSGAGELRPRRERSKWLYFWYIGRFPTDKELSDDEKDGKGGKDG